MIPSHVCLDSCISRTALHPCSIETLDLSPGSIDRSFLVGSYELDEATGDRRGQIAVMNQYAQVLGESTLNAGILDMKVLKGRQSNNFVAAESSGYLSLYSIQDDNTNKNPNGSSSSKYLLNQITQAAPEDGPFGLTLSVDVCDDTIVASYQEAAIAIYSITESDLIQTGLSLVHTHTMGGQDQPVWTVAFNRHEGSGGQCFLSGGDDCCMRIWDVRAGHATPVHTGLGRRYMYEAGVTSAQWHPEQKHILATGSYDEHVRIWDDRALATPLHKVHTGK